MKSIDDIFFGILVFLISYMTHQFLQSLGYWLNSYLIINDIRIGAWPISITCVLFSTLVFWVMVRLKIRDNEKQTNNINKVGIGIFIIMVLITNFVNSIIYQSASELVKSDDMANSLDYIKVQSFGVFILVVFIFITLWIIKRVMDQTDTFDKKAEL